MSKDFNQLTTRGQARRLRALAFNALQHYAIEIKKVSLLSNEYNCIFRVDTRNGQRYILRICLPTEESALTVPLETWWLHTLQHETSLQVLSPIPTSSGELFCTAHAPGIPEARVCVLFTWVKGKDLEQTPTPKNWHAFGRYTAQLHQHAQQLSIPHALYLRTYNKVFPFKEPTVLFDEQSQKRFSPGLCLLLIEAKDRVQKTLEALTKDESFRTHLLHGDLHHWNVKVYRGQIAAIDFEDLMVGYPIQDIAITMYYMIEHDAYSELFAAYKEGYEEILSWPWELELMDTFIAGRILVLLNGVCQSPLQSKQDALQDFFQRCERRLTRILHSGTLSG